LFVNTHPTETKDACRQDLLESLRRLRAEYPSVPLTLEVHERAITDPDAMRNLRVRLSELDIELAYDDFGAGQARLLEISDVPPDYLKFDATLIRDIDSAAASRQQMLETLVRMVHDLGIAALAEGVETAAEAEVCTDLGFHFAQGYHYGRPAPASALLSAFSC
jgi:EAL domain-containing protein (putative c-di-GMP-specific phosphodiesterase class I)